MHVAMVAEISIFRIMVTSVRMVLKWAYKSGAYQLCRINVAI